MKKIIISSIIISLCITSGVNAMVSEKSSGSSVTTNSIVKKPIKKPIVKKSVTPKTPKSQLTQTGSSSISTGTTIAPGAPLGKEKGPLAVVLYKYIKADVTSAQIAYIDTSIQEIKAGLAYYEQERDPTLTPEKIKLNMKAFLSSAVNEMSDRDIFQPRSLDALKKDLNGLIDGLGK